MLLMDEPTNHLDVDGILWLETLLADRARAVLVVSHDRYFLEHVATRMLELEPGLSGRPLRRPMARTASSSRAATSSSAARLPTRSRWPTSSVARSSGCGAAPRRAPPRRRGASGRPAGSSRSSEDARARAAGRHRRYRAVGFDTPDDASYSSRGGSSKSARRSHARPRPRPHASCPAPTSVSSARTAVARRRCWTCSPAPSSPDAGEIEQAERAAARPLRAAPREPRPRAALRRALAPDGDTVVFQGRSVHVASWAKRFLFRPEQLELPVGRLSGGEQARVLIARLMQEPADLLVLDEPTNDLDIPTLEVLEDSLAEFAGAPCACHPRPLHARARVQRRSWLSMGKAARRRSPTMRSGRRPGPTRCRPRATAIRRRRRAPDPESSAWDTSSSASGTAWKARSLMRRLPSRLVCARRRIPASCLDPAALQARYAALQTARAQVDRLYTRWAELDAKQPDT